MTRAFSPYLLLSALLGFAVAAAAADLGELPLRVRLDRDPVLEGATAGQAKAAVDTVVLFGGPVRPEGRFEDAAGNPGWYGWTHVDNTVDPDVYWQVSPYLAPAGQYAMWCGTVYAGGDHGYGNDWSQSLVFTHQVADPGLAATVVWTATLRVDTEPAYDFVYLEANRGDWWSEWDQVAAWDGLRVLQLEETIVYAPGDYVNGDEIQLRVRFDSDGAWSDGDGLYLSDGACQLDDVRVTVDGVQVDFEDFEDQASDRWVPVPEPGVGDYAALYRNLYDVDPCVENRSTQVAFVDDGVVVPGTGGTPCVTWCYGPGGYIVNNTGGLMGPDYHINNGIISPPIAWAAGCNRARMSFSVYRHEELGNYDVWPGVFYQWSLRSTDDPVNQPLAAHPWWAHDFVHYGPPGYVRHDEIISDLLVPDVAQLQLQLKVIEYGFAWGWVGQDGTPAPYFDNVAVKAWHDAGPMLSAVPAHLANDAFPASGVLDLQDLASNSVRFDMARNISPAAHLRNDPGDSIVCAATAIESALVERPLLHVRMRANPLFAGVRALPDGFSRTPGFFPDGADLVAGSVAGDSTYGASGGLVADRYNFDLPDTGFFFPGDILHYFFAASADAGGEVVTALLPADTTGFASFHHDLRYDADFIVRALPSVLSTMPGDQPPILFWNDGAGRGGEDEWHFALGNLGLYEGLDYDIYTTRSPTSGTGNGLGGRATAAVLDGYDILLYSCADLSAFLLGNGDHAVDPSRDLQVLGDWFALGGKHAFMTGDNLVSGLVGSGALGAAFVNDLLGVSWVGSWVGMFIGNQTSPLVRAIPGNGIIARADEWIAYGGCPRRNTFDAIEVAGDAVRLAEFTDAVGNTGVYTYAAATYHHNTVQDARVLLLPFDFLSIRNAPGWTPPTGHTMAVRAILLQDFLDTIGPFGGLPIGVAPDAALAVRCYPNPFNPRVTIALSLPRADEVTVKLYDVRGALVRTLVQERFAAGSHELVWDGADDRGAPVGSGVYFAETRTGGAVDVRKLALVR